MTHFFLGAAAMAVLFLLARFARTHELVVPWWEWGLTAGPSGCCSCGAGSGS